MCLFLESSLKRRGFDAAWRTGGDEAFRLLGAEPFDVVVTDLNMRGLSGIELCDRIVANHPDVPVIVITAFGSLETAVAAIRAGAYDFITKPFDVEVLEIALARAVQHRNLREEVRRLRRAVTESGRFGELLGSSPAMQGLFRLLRQVAPSEASVLIRGETGTGKELVARALHDQGPRKDGPFVAINCAAIPEALLESELFGHVKGAFTGATEARQGLLVRASGGTLFLDEIGDMPLTLQAKLLRSLQERTVRPIGGADEVAFDARLITATHRDLESAVEEGRFREDLFFRLNVIGIDVPPLRARGSDVLLLGQHFLEALAARADKRVTGFTSAAAERLTAYGWPGNVRELQNCIERAVALTEHERLIVEDLPEVIRSYRASHVLVAADDPSELVPMEEVERRYVLRVLEAVRGNKSLAARVLGFDRKTLYRKLERYGVAGAGEGEAAAPAPG
ncbi:MAG: sigma-54-dependent Fis family transcriptional regulator [Planctomycetes bacterium]|nr:sigma-54-dependent Fis family transcriptional regulator [Planctomycetota bacterium]